MTLIVLFISFIILTPNPAKASTFDGTYNYKYTMRAPGGNWATHNVPTGFIVQNGRVSSNPSWLSGTVDSSGNAYFTGSSPYGQEHGTAVYTGVIKSDGTGSGTYRDSTGLTGSWSVTRVSGGGGSDVAETIWTILSIFSPIGELFGFSGGTAAAIGVAAVVVPIVMIGSIVSTRSSMKKQQAETRRAAERQGSSGIMDQSPKPQPQIRYKRELGYTASQPTPPPASSQQEIPPPIDSSSAQPIGGVGVSFNPPLPSTLDLRAIWGDGQVRLNWDTPEFDANKYQLDGYVISKMTYGPTSTAVQQTQIAQLSPQYTQWRGFFDQTYRWNTAGDWDGFKVEALLREINGSGPGGTILIPSRVYVPP
jgi:hypothetical protein